MQLLTTMGVAAYSGNRYTRNPSDSNTDAAKCAYRFELCRASNPIAIPLVLALDTTLTIYLANPCVCVSYVLHKRNNDRC